MTDTTDDRFLGGRIKVRQPVLGFRSGLDAVMLAAAIPVSNACEVLELGSGSGAASLCLAARAQDCTVTGVERDAKLVELAMANAAANGMGERVRFVAGDALSLPPEMRREFAHVFANPPFHDVRGQDSPDDARNRALKDEGTLGAWLVAGAKRVTAGGTFTVILRADRLADALAAWPASGVTILPLWPKSGVPAKRLILQLRKGSQAPLALLPGLVLHMADGSYTAQADAVLRDGASLALDRPRL